MSRMKVVLSLSLLMAVLATLSEAATTTKVHLGELGMSMPTTVEYSRRGMRLQCSVGINARVLG